MSFDVETIRNPEKLYRNIKCSGCEVELKPVHNTREDGAWECLQPDDTLVLHLSGGYGMAIDPMGDATESDLTVLLCRNCIPKMCEQWPAIFKVVKEHCSSSLGHHCSKVRDFVWQPYSECCNIYCPKCNAWAANDRIWETIPDEDNPGYNKSIDRGLYYRFDIRCRKCDFSGPSIWGWEKNAQNLPSRIWIHGDVHDKHGECPDPNCCNCDCRVCQNVWENAHMPIPKDCSEHGK